MIQRVNCEGRRARMINNEIRYATVLVMRIHVIMFDNYATINTTL